MGEQDADWYATDEQLAAQEVDRSPVSEHCRAPHCWSEYGTPCGTCPVDSSPVIGLSADEAHRILIALAFGDPSGSGQADPKLEAAKQKLRAMRDA